MSNGLSLISSHQALFALQSGPCRVARQGWPWGMWVESFDDGSINVIENDEISDHLWEPEFSDHTLKDWYILDERPKEQHDAY